MRSDRIRRSKRCPDLLDIQFRPIKLYDAEFLAKSLESAASTAGTHGEASISGRPARLPDDLGFGSSAAAMLPE